MPTSYMLPIAKIKEGINKGIREDRSRATHGDTSLNAFFIDNRGNTFPWGDWGKLERGHGAYFDEEGYHKRFNPGAVMVHSHAAENWAHFEQITGAREPLTSFSIGDIQFLQHFVRENVGNTLALIHADGRLDLLRVPEGATDGFLGLNKVNIAMQASPPKDWERFRKAKYETWGSVQRRFVREFAKSNRLEFKEGLRWKPKGKVVEPLVKRRSFYPRPKYPWYEMIWRETGSPAPGITETTLPYWLVIPKEAWPGVPQQMELFRTSPRILRRGTYTHLTPWPGAQWEPQQMRFFGATERKTPAELAKMQLRRDKFGFQAYIDWSSGREEEGQMVYDAYYWTGDRMSRPLPGDWIKQMSEPAGAPEQLTLFGARGRHPADLDAAIDLALKKVVDKPIYVYATYYGFAVTQSRPPSTQTAVIVYPDKRVILSEYRGREGTVETPLRSKQSKQLTLFGQVQPELIFKRAPEASDPIPPELEPLAELARKYHPAKVGWTPGVIYGLEEVWRKLHFEWPRQLPHRKLEDVLAHDYGYASGDPERSIQAFWYHVHGYSPDHGRLPQEDIYRYPSPPAFGYVPTPREKQRGRKLMYLWRPYWQGGGPTVISRSKVPYFKERSGKQGDLYAEFAYSADHAREMIMSAKTKPYHKTGGSAAEAVAVRALEEQRGAKKPVKRPPELKTYYMFFYYGDPKPVSRPKSYVPELIRMQQRGEGKLYEVKAKTVEQARSLVKARRVAPYREEKKEMIPHARPKPLTPERIKRDLSPVRKYFADKVLPNRASFTRSLETDIVRSAYNAMGLKEFPSAEYLEELKPHVHALLEELRAEHGRITQAPRRFTLTREAWQPSFELPPRKKPTPRVGAIRKADLSSEEKKALDAIGDKSVHIDDIGRKAGLPPYKVSAALVMLELKGIVQQTAGKMFHTKKQPTPSLLSGNGFSGRIAHCGIWDRDKYTGNLICRQYFTACQVRDRCLTVPELPKGQTRVCTTFKKVPSVTTTSGVVSRCAHYEPVCQPVGCITSAAPHPEPEQLDPKEVRAVAHWFLEREKEATKLDPKWLAREILSRGGIRAYRKRYPGQKTDEEYMALPLFLKNKTGLPPDEMAAEMGYETDVELYRDIHAAYPPTMPKTKIQKQLARQKPTWRDYEEVAINYLMEKRGWGIYA